MKAFVLLLDAATASKREREKNTSHISPRAFSLRNETAGWRVLLILCHQNSATTFFFVFPPSYTST